jgi:hypothetical protein
VSRKNQKNTKNPLKSGNPAVVAAAKAAHNPPVKAKTVPAVQNSSSSNWKPSGNPEPKPAGAVPKYRSPQQKKNDRFRKFGQITIVLFFLAGLIMSMFSGLSNQTFSNPAPAPTETSKTLVDNNGNPIDGSSTPVTLSPEDISTAPAPDDAPTEVPVPAAGG